MPQLSQLSEVYLSQFLWLAVALGFIFFVIARGMVPKIQATVDAREQRIASDLEAAQKARTAADETEAALARANGCAPAPKPLASRRRRRRQAVAKQKPRSRPLRTRSTPRSNRRKARSATRSLAARAEIEAVAAEATQEMVGAADRNYGRQGRCRRGGEGGAQCLARC